MTSITLRNDHASAIVSPSAGASLRSLRVRARGAEHELLAGGEGSHDSSVLPSGTGSFVMAPWNNRILRGQLRGCDGSEHELPLNSGIHAIHGTARDAAWDVTQQSDSTLECRCALTDPWPWPGSVVQTFELIENRLRMTLAVESNEDEFPAGVGWHPWFKRTLASDTPVSVRVAVGNQWEIDDTMTPSGRTQPTESSRRLAKGSSFEPGELDSCFDRPPGVLAQLAWPEVALEVEMSDSISHLMVYTPEDALCLEPQTTAVNAFQLRDQGCEGTGTRHASPAHPVTASTTWSWK